MSSLPPKTEYFEKFEKIFEQLNKAHSNSKNHEEKEMLEKVGIALQISVDAMGNVQNLRKHTRENMGPAMLAQIKRIHNATGLIERWRKALLQKPILRARQLMKASPTFEKVVKYEEYASKKGDSNLTEAESAAIEAILFINNNDALAYGIVPPTPQILDAIDDMKLLFGLYAQPSDQFDIHRSEIHWKPDENVYSNWLKTSEDQKIKASVKKFQEDLFDKLSKLALVQEFKLAMARYVKASLKTGQFVQGTANQLSKILNENPNIAEFIVENILMLQEANKKLAAFVKKEYTDKGRKILPKKSTSTPTSRRASLEKLKEARSKLSLSSSSKENTSLFESRPKKQDEADALREHIRELGFEYYMLYFRKSTERKETKAATTKMSLEETEKKTQYTKALLELVEIITPEVGEINAKKSMLDFEKTIHEKAMAAHQKEKAPLISRNMNVSGVASPSQKMDEVDKNKKTKPTF